MPQSNAQPTTPTDFKQALKLKPLANAVWQSLTPLARWDFIIYINQTKDPDTRKRRIAKSISLLTAKKRRPCCFTIVPADLYKAFLVNPKAKTAWANLNAIERRKLVSWIDKGSNTKTRAEKACLLMTAK